MGHLYNLILLGYKIEKFTLCDSMDGPGGHYASEISQAKKDQSHMISIIHGV